MKTAHHPIFTAFFPGWLKNTKVRLRSSPFLRKGLPCSTDKNAVLFVQVFFLILITYLLTGCETLNNRIDKNTGYFNSLPRDHQALIRNKNIKVGFTQKEVYIAWGSSDHTVITETSRGSLEKWIYLTVRTEPYYQTRKRYDKDLGRWIYVNEPQHISREYLDKEVVFVDDRVDAWTKHPAFFPYRRYPY